MITTPSRLRKLNEIAAENHCSLEFAVSLFSKVDDVSENKCFDYVAETLATGSFTTRELMNMHHLKYNKQIIFPLYDLLTNGEFVEDITEYCTIGKWSANARSHFQKNYFSKLIAETDWIDLVKVSRHKIDMAVNVVKEKLEYGYDYVFSVFDVCFLTHLGAYNIQKHIDIFEYWETKDWSKSKVFGKMTNSQLSKKYLLDQADKGDYDAKCLIWNDLLSDKAYELFTKNYNWSEEEKNEILYKKWHKN